MPGDMRPVARAQNQPKKLMRLICSDRGPRFGAVRPGLAMRAATVIAKVGLVRDPSPLPIEIAAASREANPFAGIEGRASVDYMLQNTQQQLVQLSGQADLKANIIVTASTLALTFALTRLGDRDIRWTLVTLIVGMACALALAIRSLLPTYRRRRRRGAAPDAQTDILFFGHFAQLPRDRYLEAMAAVVRDDAVLYRTMVENLHNLGRYLETSRYRYLRYSYIALLVTIGAAAMQQIITIAVR
jgi:hypothetical protein